MDAENGQHRTAWPAPAVRSVDLMTHLSGCLVVASIPYRLVSSAGNPTTGASRHPGRRRNAAPD